jgi:hypothetical protein
MLEQGSTIDPIFLGKKVGCVGVVVDAKPHAISFYERYGFIRLETLEGNLGELPVTPISKPDKIYVCDLRKRPK